MLDRFLLVVSLPFAVVAGLFCALLFVLALYVHLSIVLAIFGLEKCGILRRRRCSLTTYQF